MNLKKIVWANDGSKEAGKALRIARYFARLYGSEINGIYVNSIFYPVTPNYVYYAGYIEEAADKNTKEFSQKFQKIKNSLLKDNIKFTSKVVRGSVDEEVNKYASSKKADLIVLGNTGKNLLTKLLLGNNTLKILRTASVPTLTVPKGSENGKYKVKKVLLPVDISEANHESIEYAVDISQRTKSHITIIYVVSVMNNFNEFPQKIIDLIITGATKELSKIKDDIKGNNKNLSISTKLQVGLNPALKISDYARRNNFDLIVMKAHNKGSVERFFLGSVGEEVVRNARCPVMLVKPQD